MSVVEDFLGRLRPAHDPSLVPGAHDVGVLGTEVSGRIQGAIGDRHLKGIAPAGGRGVDFHGVGHADARASGICPRPGGGSAQRDGDLGMLALSVHEFGVEVPVGDQFRQLHHDAGVRTDRVGADHLDPRGLGGVCGGGTTRHDCFFCHLKFLLFISSRVYPDGPRRL